MNIYMYIESSELADIAEDVSTSIEAWISESCEQAILVNRQQEQDRSLSDEDYPDWDLGINIVISKGRELKEPLSFLYKLAKKHKCEFVLGLYNNENISE
ncbi:MAG: hypothetical protein OQJ89_13830, partial [Kangiellaceae bacterium]|nr:hypothetical protein [Kangiellaceae bacterium]